jgi:hypothetical protein
MKDEKKTPLFETRRSSTDYADSTDQTLTKKCADVSFKDAFSVLLGVIGVI